MGSIPSLAPQLNNLSKLLIPMCLCHQAVQFGTGLTAVMPCGWEGKREVWRNVMAADR